MQRNLGIARDILSARLQLLVATGILERSRYQAEPERASTGSRRRASACIPPSSRSCAGATSACARRCAPVALRSSCGELADPVMVCSACGERLDPRHVTPEPAELAFR